MRTELLGELKYNIEVRKKTNILKFEYSRKEVFQPHLPVRLPCYDLALVTGLTLISSFNGHLLQVHPTSMA